MFALSNLDLISFFFHMYFKISKKDEIVRRLEGDLSNLQETVRSYAEEVRCDTLTPDVKLEHQGCRLVLAKN